MLGISAKEAALLKMVYLLSCGHTRMSLLPQLAGETSPISSTVRNFGQIFNVLILKKIKNRVDLEMHSSHSLCPFPLARLLYVLYHLDNTQPCCKVHCLLLSGSIWVPFS